ncbi:3-deoxy-D-manno-octulosonic acid transferase [Yoonia sediminilitoris]|uniref:3-deoxy-D-manno-octulosonic acid transferase n=1 Tax=Yoonia sediminilitoris TaxID=1286148 RepID=A0A2T6K9U7_9RHOB|nr:glycosyltransferase N-terminal domain-containing protein [Yoonia sediminilitoris]PUB11588.1 3-deoxy-D-manno-octulosonic-acid transferase [Yoonia sediminilitoris]RCW91788.1 3-deoxy-D-manno-octulosonic-acid transferase [Yoonia sediminilitoris]
MARSLSIAAYLAGLGGQVSSDTLAKQPPRPFGAVIWARCCHPDQLTAIETLNRKLTEDGDPVQVIATLPKWEKSLSDRALPEPRGRDNIRLFMDHWNPVMGIWVRGDLDPILLDEWREADLPSLFVDATAEGLEQVAGSWVPGAMRSLLSQFEAVLTLDQTAAEGLIRAGTPQEVVRVTGPMEDCAPPLPCEDKDRQSLAKAVGTRPVWLAVAVPESEIADICKAHKFASHRAHRLLLIIVPRDPIDAFEFAAHMQENGFYTTLRSEEPDPDELTQVYVDDIEDELGLWYRISPVTYIGGTLQGGGCRDPFEPAALGSAVLYGPQVTPFQKHAGRLNAAGASHLIRSGSDLGPLVEELLATDKVATLAHAAWDVTSRGADVTNRIVRIIQRRTEELGL